MSEIEKRCPRCGGSGEQDDGYCARCGGYGTVVDVEGQLRAEVARLTVEHARLLIESMNLCAENTRLHGMVDWDVANACKDALAEERAEVTRLTATLAERDGEVARLEGRVGRPLAIGDVITVDGEVGMVAWVGSERCRVVWSTEATTSEPNDTALTARAAWLAGCRP